MRTEAAAPDEPMEDVKATLRAQRGALIRLRARRAGERDRVGTVLQARGVNGEPPFVVRWEDSGAICFVQPGTDAVIEQRAGFGGPASGADDDDPQVAGGRAAPADGTAPPD